MSLNENEQWILSYYRSSEINGSLFFGRVARRLPPGAVQLDLSKHFADEAQHAWYWTQCLDRLGGRALKLTDSYQDRYFEAVGAPMNLMEILAITQIFERRIINQYARHRRVPGLAAPIVETLDRIMEDEKWHLRWVAEALDGLAPRFGAEQVKETLDRYARADREIYEKTLHEVNERLGSLVPGRG